MAGPSISDLEKVAVEYVCRMHGFERSDFIRCEADIRTGQIKFAFKAPKYPADVLALANKIHDLLDDPLRGEVARSVTPVLSADAAALADTILNSKTRVVTMDRDFFIKL